MAAIVCAGCSVEFTSQDGIRGRIVEEDGLLYHRECASSHLAREAEVPGIMSREEEEAEEQARQDHSDVPLALPPVLKLERPFRDKQRAVWIVDRKTEGVMGLSVEVEDSAGNRRRGQVLKVEHRLVKRAWIFRWRGKVHQRRLRVYLDTKLCVECGEEPAIGGGRGFLCRGRSMLP